MLKWFNKIHSRVSSVNAYKTSIGFPWLWFKPIWYLSGIGFEFDRLVKLTNDFIRSVIAERKRTMEEEGLIDGDGSDLRKEKLAFLDLLLRMQRENQLTDEDIREEVDTFMFEDIVEM
ncbi:hypothetical protein ANCDUO_24630 [Ancylostoma duodenale]|uniref:Cytochrome P450 n=1 Tax=Ancylostoma duodenale TaxID=51022 RepID=A0A0C2FA65_9BILA|nr:hypothetical protein ANCDUO_24630 [Ancylostoma duodenale]